MDTYDTSDEHWQQFQVKGSPDSIPILARQDLESGKDVIFWEDVQSHFQNAKGVLNNGTGVLFLVDDRLNNLLPLRIPYHPETVLEVVFSDACCARQDSMTSISVSSFPEEGLTDKDSVDQVTNGFDEHTPPISVATVNVHATNARPSGSSNAQRAMSDGFHMHSGTYQSEVLLNKYMRLQEENQQQHQQMIHMHQQSRQIQQEAYYRTGMIQSDIHTLLTQNYELHEYPIPRLFIILPKPSRFHRDGFKHHHFRLHFLCECGDHTMSEDCVTSPKIHLAEHEGYDLDNPTEFFKKYGAHVLAMMYMFKMGIAADGLVVPPLASFNGDGADLAPKLNGMHDLGQAVEISIAFLEGLKSKGNDGAPISDNVEALDVADLRQLESHLKLKIIKTCVLGKSCVLGNLHRIVTPKGHVKWVCMEHYRIIHKESPVQRLRDILNNTHGSIDEQLGEIRIVLVSGSASSEFFSALSAVQGFQKLIVNLQWDATKSELKEMADAVTQANIMDLTIDGSSLLGRNMDVIHRFNRFDPLLKLRNNERIQTLRLVLFKDLFYRLSHKAFTPALNMRVLKLHSPIDGGHNPWDTNLDNILESCPNIREFGLRIQDQFLIVPAIERILSKLHDLRRLEIYFGEFHTTATVFQGRVHTVEMFLPFTEALAFEGRNHSCYATVLDEDLGLDQAIQILRLYPMLSEIKLGYVYANPNTMIETIANTRDEVAATSLHKVDLMRLHGEAGAPPVGITMDFTDHEGTTLGCSLHINVSSWSGELSPYYDILYSHGSSIKALDARNGCIDDEIARLLEQSTNNNSKLGTLTLDTWTLTNKGLEYMDRVISRSKSLERFVVDQSLNSEEEREKATLLVSQHGKKLTGLLLLGDGSHPMTEWLKTTFPSRAECPRLSDFRLAFNIESNVEDPDAYVQWLTLMVSAPDAATPTAWSPLKRLCLQHNKFGSVDWGSLIEAIDFSALENLDFSGTNFADEQLDLLIKCVVKTHELVPLRTLDLRSSTLSMSVDLAELHSKLDEFREIAPHVTIVGLEAFDIH
ncbi:hypothetical protein BGX34_000885 [Mortierella sp. NVP85]|nr:hypothetical protein BGX34_000885 [Mortierella sp. NVP85]